MANKLKLATASFAGCFGCHMSLLDIDEKLIDLLELVEFDRTPLTDVKRVGTCDIGLIEGGVANAENVHVLREFREHCKTVVAVGACAINGGIPAMRNEFELKECLEEAYFNGIGVENPLIPNDPEIPLLLDKVRPAHEVVKIDYFIPGCPPSAEVIWSFLNDLITGQPHAMTYKDIRYD